MILGFLKSTWAIIAKPCLLTLKRLEGVGKGGGLGPPWQISVCNFKTERDNDFSFDFKSSQKQRVTLKFVATILRNLQSKIIGQPQDKVWKSSSFSFFLTINHILSVEYFEVY